jgi:hypothetical protein
MIHVRRCSFSSPCLAPPPRTSHYRIHTREITAMRTSSSAAAAQRRPRVRKAEVAEKAGQSAGGNHALAQGGWRHGAALAGGS